MRAWLVVLVACGCGRINFDHHGDGGVGDADATGDGPVAACAFRDVDVGRDHTCAIDGNGAVFCWGLDNSGQVTGTPSGTKRLPTKITLPAVAVQLAIGRDFSCARVTGDDVYCWGDNQSGQLGIGSTAVQTGPVKVDLGGDTAVAIDAGASQACVIRASDHAVMCWGGNSHFAVGTSPINAIVSTPSVLAGTQNAQSLGLGHRHNCATIAGSAPVCWGRGDYAQLADGMFSDHVPAATTVLPALTAIASGGRHSCGVDTSGDLYCWGRNGDGELGRATSDTNPHNPGAAIQSGVTQVAAGTESTCSIHGTGALSCWGELPPADGTFALHLAPFDTPITDAAKISVAFYHACAIRKTGELTCWGSNLYGELGRGTRSLSALPVAPSIGATTDIEVGNEHACALSQGQVYCWGDNSYGELGTGDRDGRRTPTLVNTGLVTVAGVAAGLTHSCAWGQGQVACWGANEFGQVGLGSSFQSTPVLVAGFGTPTRVVGQSHATCAIDSGTVKCWGLNNAGQLGNNSTTTSATPVTVNNITSATQICAGDNHACVIDSGVIKCWGDNGAGQLGDNSQTNRLQPVTVALANPIAIACGNTHTCAIDSTNTVSCWGRNGSGELGQGTYGPPILVPTMVSLPTTALEVFADGYATCAKVTGGKIYCWGDGERGQFGNGIFASSATPIESVPLAGSSTMDLGRTGGCAINQGVVSCFGDPSLLGTGNVDEATPMSPSFTCTQ